MQSEESRGIRSHGVFFCFVFSSMLKEDVGCWTGFMSQEGEAEEEEERACSILEVFFILPFLFFFHCRHLPSYPGNSPHFGTRTHRLKFVAAGKSPERIESAEDLK